MMEIRAIGFSQSDFQSLNRVDDIYLKPFDTLGQRGIERGEFKSARAGDNPTLDFEAFSLKLFPEGRKIRMV